MRLIGTQPGYWKRICKAQRQRKQRMKKVNGCVLTSAADCERFDDKQLQKQTTSNSFRGNEGKSPACSDQPHQACNTDGEANDASNE